jgi:hypothetical protein
MVYQVCGILKPGAVTKYGKEGVWFLQPKFAVKLLKGIFQ